MCFFRAFFLFALVFCVTPALFADEKLREVPVSKSSATRIVYASSPWNLEPSKVDSAFLFLREPKTGRIAKVILDESEPDSSTFSGSFSLNWGNLEDVRPQVFIPPQNLRGQKGLEKFKQLLVNKKIPRKPLVFRRDDNGTMILDVYDTREQAEKAVELYRKEIALKKANASSEKLLEDAKADQATIAAGKMAEDEKKKREKEIEANRLEAERIRMEQLEKQKAAERQQKMKSMAASERKRRAEEAQRLSQQALQLFQKADFVGAAKLYSEAVELDPENKNYYLNYAISLYRQKKYNEAIVILKLTPNGDRQIEKDFYLGLSYYQIENYGSATEPLERVKNTGNKEFTPSAAFYLGVIKMKDKKWEPAKAEFEFVLDNSTDPEMDNRAEAYIEAISAQQAWDKKKEQPFTLTAMLGASYDSNVLLAPDGVASQGSAIEGDIRGLLMAQLEYRAIFEKTHEWVPQIMTYYQRSSKDSVSSADAFLNNVSLPYIHKGTAFGKGYKLTAKPAYEMINMDINQDGDREGIITSTIGHFDNTFVMSKMWIASYIFEARFDDSLLPSSTGTSDGDAMKYTLKTKNINFLNEKRKKILMTNLGLVYNDAKGSEKIYHRIEAGATYLKPLNWWKTTWTLGVSTYLLQYPDASSDRKDTNLAVNTGFTRPINDWLTFGLTLNYTNNSSNVSANQYDKYTITTNVISKNVF